jgi:hypothetical protein
VSRKRAIQHYRHGPQVIAMTVCAFVLRLLALLAIASTAAAQERIISKPDADMIFAFTRAEWERYVRQVAPPEGWTIRLLPHDTGTALARFNRSTGIGASVQPLFKDDQGPPGMIVVGTYYPLGSMHFTDEAIKKIEQSARLDLGPAYSVSANHAKMPGTNLEAIELIVTRETVAQRGSTMEPRSFKCEQPLPEFTLGRASNPSDEELAKLCTCIWSKLPEGGWEREVSAKIRRGEDPGWRGRGFVPRFGAAVDACGGRSL